MKVAPLPENEAARLAKLNRYRVLDTPPEAAFDRITRMVADLIGVPIALVSLVDGERQWFKSRHGIAAPETPRDVAFCAHAILGNELFLVEDATKDSRFADNPLVVGEPSVRFYAGAPLQTPDGLNLGTLCAIDRTPRTLTDRQRQLLLDLASIVVDELELRVALRQAMAEIGEEVARTAAKDEFVSLVTHELRSPLTSIRGSLGLLTGGAIAGIPQDAAKIIEIANRNAVTLIELVNDLLDIQKFEAGKIDLDVGTFDSGTLARETGESMAGFGEARGIDVRVDVGATATIAGDNGRLSQVLRNLISNAVKFSPDGGTVVVASDIVGDRVRFSVTDRGSGIPESFRDRVFQKFSQAKGENKTKGTGLGLAISKAIVEAHRGTIRFETVTGKGTTFHVELPLKQSVLP